MPDTETADRTPPDQRRSGAGTLAGGTAGSDAAGATAEAGDDGAAAPSGNGAGGGDDAPRRPAPGRSGARLAYNPALDGIRGIAVAAVLLFHGGFSWARGGYLGVSTFFTLSGFLITSLLIAERTKTGRVRLSAFWARRLRRLFPASALALAGISLSAIVVDEAWERSLRGDVLSGLLQVANWRFLLDDRSYGELFSSPSPVLHFWSLAIEEQFYWVFPLLTAGVFALGKGSLKLFGGVLATLLAGSAALTLVLGTDSRTAIYYATPVRMGEILVGALLAVGVAAGLTRGETVRWGAAVAGIGALAVTAWAWWNIGEDSPRLAQGGLLAYALVSGALVLSATVPGPVRRLLAVPPLRLLGVVSYGVYLYHWPIFLLLDGKRTGLEERPRVLFLVQVAVTLVVAIASYVLVEKPIRSGWRPAFRLRPLRRLQGFRAPMPALAGGTFALVALVAVTVPVVSKPPVDPYELLAEGGQDPDPASIPDGALIGLTVGDSTMFRTAWGLSLWGDETGALELMAGGGGIGCGLTRGGVRRYLGEVGPANVGCDDEWETVLPDAVDRRRERYGHVDFAFIQTGPWDVTDRRLPGDDTWRHPGDPVFDAYLRSELSLVTDLLLEQGVTVVWATAPHIEAGATQQPPPPEPYPESDPARIDRLNQIIREIADAREGAVVVDLQGYLASLPGGEMDRRLRPDGVHFENETAQEVANWLGPEILRAIETESPPSIPQVAEDTGSRVAERAGD
ncbi:MAG TPA: acyltransferase family protein [Acidimicrobiales bacterium]